MKVYLALEAEIGGDYQDSGLYPTLNAIVYRTKGDFPTKYYHLVLKIDAKELPAYGVDFDVPTTTEKYRQWYQRNGKWANEIAPLIGKTRFTAPPRRKPVKHKGSKL